MAACVVCNGAVQDARERRVLLNERSKHVIPYLADISSSLPIDTISQYVSATNPLQRSRDQRIYICKRCFRYCEKGMDYEKATETQHELAMRLLAWNTGESHSASCVSACQPQSWKRARLEPSSARSLTFSPVLLPAEATSSAVTVSVSLQLTFRAVVLGMFLLLF